MMSQLSEIYQFYALKVVISQAFSRFMAPQRIVQDIFLKRSLGIIKNKKMS